MNFAFGKRDVRRVNITRFNFNRTAIAIITTEDRKKTKTHTATTIVTTEDRTKIKHNFG